MTAKNGPAGWLAAAVWGMAAAAPALTLEEAIRAALDRKA